MAATVVKPEHIEHEPVAQDDHDYCQQRQDTSEFVTTVITTRTFAKCENCRKSRTKVMIPESLIDSLPDSKDDGKTCDFCGAVVKPSNDGLLQVPKTKHRGKCF